MQKIAVYIGLKEEATEAAILKALKAKESALVKEHKEELSALEKAHKEQLSNQENEFKNQLSDKENLIVEEKSAIVQMRNERDSYKVLYDDLEKSNKVLRERLEKELEANESYDELLVKHKELKKSYKDLKKRTAPAKDDLDPLIEKAKRYIFGNDQFKGAGTDQPVMISTKGQIYIDDRGDKDSGKFKFRTAKAAAVRTGQNLYEVNVTGKNVKLIKINLQ